MPRLLMAMTVPLDVRCFLLPIVQHFKAQGWQVDIMLRSEPGYEADLAIFDRVWDIDWSRNPLDPSNFIHCPAAIQKIALQEDYDLIHVHTPVAAFVTRFALRNLRRKLKAKIIYTAHGFHFYKGGSAVRNAIFLNLEKLAGRWTDCLVVINREDEQAALRHTIVATPDQVCYMPGIGLDRSYYSPQAVSEGAVAQVRHELKLGEANPLFLMIAEFNPGKRHADALNAFARLASSDAHLAFAGKGPLFEPMQTLAATLGIRERVHFLGYRNDIPTLIRASVATLLPSAREGLPRSIMESLNLEVPVIGTNIRGVRDLLEDGGGILVEVGDQAGLTRAMNRMLENPQEAIEMGQRGCAYMANYDLNNILALHEKLYARLLGRDLWLCQE